MTLLENDKAWAEYVNCMKRLEAQLKLVAYHALETARQVEETAKQADIAVKNVREFLKGDSYPNAQQDKQ